MLALEIGWIRLVGEIWGKRKGVNGNVIRNSKSQIETIRFYRYFMKIVTFSDGQNDKVRYRQEKRPKGYD